MKASQLAGPNVALQRLLLKAGFHSTAASRALWFGESQLVGNVLIAPDFDTAGLIERCFLLQLQAVMGDLVLRVEKFSEPKKASAPVASVFKKAYTGKADPGRQRDLL